MPPDLTNEAAQGYAAAEGAKNPFLSSSPCAIAWDAGRWLQNTGRPAPREVRMSRGYTVRVNDMLVRWNAGTCERIS